MKIRLKMTLAMLCLLSVLFGIGGSALISLSFQGTLKREQESVQGTYQMLLNTLQLVTTASPLQTPEEIADILEQLLEENTFSWSALRLSTQSKIIHESGYQSVAWKDLQKEADHGECLLTNLTDESGYYLQLTGAFSIGKESYYLEVLEDVSDLYLLRNQQETVFRLIYFVLIIVCAVLAYIISFLLTRSLSKLTETSKEIAAGDFSSRSGINANDEIGVLSQEFDNMAAQTEKNISKMTETMQQQERFMAAFTHELKTPMASIIGHADLLRSGILTQQEQAEAAQYIFAEGKRLESLSLKLLELFVAEKQELVFSNVAVAELIETIADAFRKEFVKKQIKLQTDCEAGNCLIEPDLVKSLVMNLLVNASHAVEVGGRITVTVEMIPNGCRIRVSDDGMGMKKEQLQHITEAFYRVDKSRSREQGGAGLGLALCAKIVDLHHGTIQFDSHFGKGTTVTVELKECSNS